MRWGLVLNWSDDDKGGVKCINARSQTIAENTAFWDAFNTRAVQGKGANGGSGKSAVP
jgi:putative SOS response-associated peptidase YedK